MKAKIKAKKPFRVKVANEYYKVCGELNTYCLEYGVNKNGKIYFQYMNGIIDRYTRRDFIKEARRKKEQVF